MELLFFSIRPLAAHTLTHSGRKIGLIPRYNLLASFGKRNIILSLLRMFTYLEMRAL
jgi:hypothetical protein